MGYGMRDRIILLLATRLLAITRNKSSLDRTHLSLVASN